MLVTYIQQLFFDTVHQRSDKSGLKVTDRIVQSAEHWCFYENHRGQCKFPRQK